MGNLNPLNYTKQNSSTHTTVPIRPESERQAAWASQTGNRVGQDATRSIPTLSHAVLNMLKSVLTSIQTKMPIRSASSITHFDPELAQNPQQSIKITMSDKAAKRYSVQYRAPNGEWKTLDPQALPAQVLTPDHLRLYNPELNSAIHANAANVQVDSEEGITTIQYIDNFGLDVEHNRRYIDVIVTLHNKRLGKDFINQRLWR